MRIFFQSEKSSFRTPAREIHCGPDYRNARLLVQPNHRSHSPKVWVGSCVRSSAAGSIEISVLDTECIRTWVDKLYLASYVVRPVIASASQGAVTTIDDVERQARL